MVERIQEIEKESKELVSQKEDDLPEAKTPEVSPERIERMKKAFRPTWLHDQINSNGKTPIKKD